MTDLRQELRDHHNLAAEIIEGLEADKRRLEEQLETLKKAAALALAVSEELGDNPYEWEAEVREILKGALNSNPASED